VRPSANAPVKPENCNRYLPRRSPILRRRHEQQSPGAMVPAAVGLAARSQWYCVVNAAVYVVADEGVVIEWDWAPLSDQLA